jgi:hypothetical protein
MSRPNIFLTVLAVAGAMSFGASAQGASADAYAAKKADCDLKADVRSFGIHLSERHRFVMRCIAGLSHEGG